MERAWGRERLRVDVIRDDVVRFKISRGGVFDETPTMAVVNDGRAEFEVDGTTLRTAALEVDLETLDVRRADGSPVIESLEPYGTLNDAFWVRRSYEAGDAIYGLGEKTGRHNRRGRGFTLWNTDILNPHAAAPFGGDGESVDFDPYYVSIPFFHHHTADGKVAASFVDNGYRAAYDFSRPDEYSFRFEGGQYTEYVFAGPSLPDIVEAYTWLTGRAAPPPLWALGYHQCRWKAYSQADVEALGARHRELGIPCDALWLDIEYMDGYRVFTWNTELFPDAPGMLERLRAQGLRVITIIDPGVKHEPGYAVFDAAVERDVLCRTEGGDIYIGEVWPGDTAFPDFVTEDGRRWWGELNAAHVQSGLAGIWNDMNEPATGAMAPERMRFNRGQDSHERWHNQYALLMAMGTRDGLLEAMPELRTFILSRAGFAGIQRYAANWMGDNQARWDHLWLSIPMANGFGLSGQPFVGADVGGFAGHSNAELFLRWLQYAALTPFCRNHSMLGDVDQYAWSWGDAVLAEARARDRAALPAAALHLQRVHHRHRDRRAGPATAGLRPPVRRRRARHRRPVPVRAGPAGRARLRAAHDRAPGLPPRGRVVRLAHRGALHRAALRDRGHADGPHPALRARGRGDPDVALGAGVDRRAPGGDRAARLRSLGHGDPRLVPAGGRRVDPRGAGRGARAWSSPGASCP